MHFSTHRQGVANCVHEYLEVSTKGGKWWRLKYRFNFKEKRLSLGVYPTVTLKIAREKCTDAKRLTSECIDPSEYRKANKAGVVYIYLSFSIFTVLSTNEAVQLLFKP